MAYDSYARQTEMLSDREKEALVFEKLRGRVLIAMRASEFDLERTRTLADLHRLWTHVVALAGDRDNQLPRDLRARIVSTALAMLRDLEEETPDLEFQAEVLRNFADGLKSGLASSASLPATTTDAPAVVTA